jgi:hypothetical protein
MRFGARRHYAPRLIHQERTSSPSANVNSKKVDERSPFEEILSLNHSIKNVGID